MSLSAQVPHAIGQQSPNSVASSFSLEKEPMKSEKPRKPKATRQIHARLRNYLRKIARKMPFIGSKFKKEERHSPALSTTSTDESEDERIWWGDVRDIDDQVLIDLAVKHLGVTHGLVCSVLERLEGSYNCAYVIQFSEGAKFVIRVPAAGRPGRWTQADADALRSQVLTMAYIRRHTNLPIPDTLFFSTSLDIEGFGYPFIISQYLPGKQLSEVWGTGIDYDEDLERKRQKILRSLAQTMSRLQYLSFPASGSLYFQHNVDDNPQVGPRHMVDESSYPNRIPYYGTAYGDTPSHLRNRLDLWWEQTKTSVSYESNPFSPEAMEANGKYEILKMAIDSLPLPDSGLLNERRQLIESFVLAPPDFDYQNILVDDDGNVTGLLDWDGVHTVPRFAGYAALPLWLTRDFTDAGWEWDGEIGNSDWDLARYRQCYAGYMYNAMEGQGDCRFTAKSHLFQLLQFGVEKENKMSWGAVRNFLNPILGRTDARAYVTKVGNEAYGWARGEEGWLMERMEELFSCELGVEHGLYV
ncbi:aminoglycoside phosphotransferase protein [Venturia nashicola]|uniref:Aminoglycoside phosphotransferase protein n=1 Tax=Venturia nashicola TaxID=86259 RepID=A0A4Z1PDQ8_9PEZI|nr:aminoglycoside phosphotransferase protein [Venturia nashicola]TLD38605.1 aminoglycoside phosphotransferase protein [Venturia nashicola]